MSDIAPQKSGFFGDPAIIAGDPKQNDKEYKAQSLRSSGKAIFDIVELLKMVEKRKFFGIIFVYIKIKLYLCSAKVKRHKIMQTTQMNFEGGVQVHNEPLVAPNWQGKRYTSHDEFWNEAYADLGKRYGLDDIREVE